ncbi:sodium:proton antiporter [Sediminitomix flava]|nr:sodium:proton antiporter [Sediminitomix flava]
MSASAVEAGGHGAPASPFSVIPFVILLTMIATGPLFYEKFWHHNYPKVAIGLALVVVVYYLFGLHNHAAPLHAFFEYFQFISLLSALYIASGGIMINIDRKGTPLANTVLLVIGAIISNIIGTTGASMLLIRPFIRLNKGRISAYHIIFFIFMVSNVGGALTPIGDPPLFLGFLKGVPFEWTLEHSFTPWVFGIGLLAILFFFVDKRQGAKEGDLIEDNSNAEYTNKISFTGAKNFLWLVLVIVAIFIDPAKLNWVPAVIEHTDGSLGISTIPAAKEAGTYLTGFSFIRELIMLSVAYFSFTLADKRAIEGNDFNFEPIREVAFIFVGIFGTMMPALELVASFAASPEGAALITHNTLYWGTGTLSGILDNAPTYLNFFTAALAAKGGDIGNLQDVVAFTEGAQQFGGIEAIIELRAISVSAVFFGAMTYIGNGPNFMVKSIAEQIGIEMPSFFGYIVRYSLPILLPILFLTWLAFFAFV